MTVRVNGPLAPRNGGSYAVVADDFVQGGFHTVADIPARDAITAGRRKAGMFVRVLSGIAGKREVYELDADMVTWIRVPIETTGEPIRDAIKYVDNISTSLPQTNQINGGTHTVAPGDAVLFLALSNGTQRNRIYVYDSTTPWVLRTDGVNNTGTPSHGEIVFASYCDLSLE